jgi:preprotein translocase subunit SecE
MKKIFAFIMESIGELKKVNWPTKDDVVAQTIVVVASLAVLSIVLGVMDFITLQAVIKVITLGL